MTTYNMTGKELYDAVMTGEYVPVLRKFAEGDDEGCVYGGAVLSAAFDRSSETYEFQVKDFSGHSDILYAASPDSKVTDVNPSRPPAE